jgi:signal transduction histidine kinase/ActR/RegA family two-component response regulator
VFKFAGLAAVLSTAISASIGVSSLTLGGYAVPAEFSGIWFTWWLGDAAGAILVTPLLVLWYSDRDWDWAPRKTLEAALLLIAIGIIGGIAFFHPVLSTYPVAFLCLAPLVWGALRFGPREVSTVVVLLAAMATAATVTGRGSFVLPTPNESLLALQSFMALIAMSALPMAALTAERALLLERERQARREADAASRAKDEFLAILGHELRNPLSAISAAAAVLDQPDGRHGAEWQRWLTIIQRQARHLARLIDDLLDVGRVSLHKMSLRRQPIELAAQVERCVQTLVSREREAATRIDLQLEPAWIDADPDRIDQIVANLVGNALKHTPPGRRIRITVRRAGAEAELRVEDEGAGIPPELLPRIFEPFTQGVQGLERAAGGLGVGLTLVRRLTELHEGTVEAHSGGAGRGSEFIVRLPLGTTSRPRAAVPGPGGPAPPCRLLIIEDNGDVRVALRVLLESVGQEVYEAADGESGISAASALAPDIVLVDIGLPGLDGYEVARRLRAANPAVGLVALTGYGQPGDHERSSRAGFDAHLVKPVGIERLSAVIAELAREPQRESGREPAIPGSSAGFR